MHPFLTAAIFFLAAEAAFAADGGCGTNAAAIIAQAYPAAEKTSETEFATDGATIRLPEADEGFGGGRHAIVCRVWPSWPKRLLVAVPLITEQSELLTAGDLELLVLDATTLNVQQRLRLKERIVDDAIQTKAITIDTARYQLAPGQIAFGVRLAREGMSKPNPFEEVSLSLYVIEGGQLKPVLDGIAVTSNRGEWDTNCAGSYDRTPNSRDREEWP